MPQGAAIRAHLPPALERVLRVAERFLPILGKRRRKVEHSCSVAGERDRHLHPPARQHVEGLRLRHQPRIRREGEARVLRTVVDADTAHARPVGQRVEIRFAGCAVYRKGLQNDLRRKVGDLCPQRRIVHGKNFEADGVASIPIPREEGLADHPRPLCGGRMADAAVGVRQHLFPSRLFHGEVAPHQHPAALVHVGGQPCQRFRRNRVVVHQQQKRHSAAQSRLHQRIRHDGCIRAVRQHVLHQRRPAHVIGAKPCFVRGQNADLRLHPPHTHHERRGCGNLIEHPAAFRFCRGVLDEPLAVVQVRTPMDGEDDRDAHAHVLIHKAAQGLRGKGTSAARHAQIGGLIAKPRHDHRRAVGGIQAGENDVAAFLVVVNENMAHLDAVRRRCQRIRLLTQLGPVVPQHGGAVRGVKAQVGVILLQNGPEIIGRAIRHGLLPIMQPQPPGGGALHQRLRLFGGRFAAQTAPCGKVLPRGWAVIAVAQPEVFRPQHLRTHSIRRHIVAATQPCSHIGQLLCIQFQELRIVDGGHGDGRAPQNVGIMQLQIAPVHVLHQRLRQTLLVLDKAGEVNVVVLAAHHNGVALAVNRAVKAFQIGFGFLLVCLQLVAALLLVPDDVRPEVTVLRVAMHPLRTAFKIGLVVKDAQLFTRPVKLIEITDVHFLPQHLFSPRTQCLLWRLKKVSFEACAETRRGPGARG